LDLVVGQFLRNSPEFARMLVEQVLRPVFHYGTKYRGPGYRYLLAVALLRTDIHTRKHYWHR
jgi:hypothetical protein